MSIKDGDVMFAVMTSNLLFFLISEYFEIIRKDMFCAYGFIMNIKPLKGSLSKNLNIKGPTELDIWILYSL